MKYVLYAVGFMLGAMLGPVGILIVLMFATDDDG